MPALLSDPFLQLPTASSVRVVWFTEFAGSLHTVSYGPDFERTAVATTTKLSRLSEDRHSYVGVQSGDGRHYQNVTHRDVWRHEAEVTGLNPGVRLPYRVTSVDDEAVSSRAFTLAPLPVPGTPLKILLTSDHQLMPMTAANLQMVEQTVGRVDAVFFAGDLVNMPDRASEWFDDRRGSAFFPVLQGRACRTLGEHTYRGGEVIQHAPLYTTIGNHEVMGVASEARLSLDARPRQVALGSRLPAPVPEQWLLDNSFNTVTYEELLTLPPSTGGGRYYAVSFGDVRLVSLYATRLWRSYASGAKGKYSEREADFDDPDAWGHGEFIFEPLTRDSPQYTWLSAELASPEFKQAKFRILMLHHPVHGVGGNIVPAFTDPVPSIEHNSDGTVRSVRYEYPKDADQLVRDLKPLIERSKVHLVLYGHCHLWNRFVDASGTHYLETSNVGNSYGAYVGGSRRANIPTGYAEEYCASGDPNGLEPVMPTIAPLRGEDGQFLPYVASNNITVFTILDTGNGRVTSYRFNLYEPDSEVVEFDAFHLSM